MLFSNLQEFAKDCDMIREIRGKGLMIGIEYRKRVKDLITQAEKKGVLMLNAGITVIRLLPPLLINDSQVEKVLEVVCDISK